MISFSKVTKEYVVIGIDHIKKSIISKVFRSELGTNHPEEESALKLLEEVLKKNLNKEITFLLNRTRTSLF